MPETHVMYAGSRLIPAPFVNITKNIVRDGAGGKIGTTFNLNIRGTLMAYKGSPNSSGVFHTTSGYPADETPTSDERLASIERKQDAIRKLFAEDGKQLEFQSADGSAPIKCNPRIQQIVFEEDRWYDTCRYAIDCEADILYGANNVGLNEDDLGGYYISSATESWSVETLQEQPQDASHPRTYQLTHTVSATGKTFYNSVGTLVQEAWENARDYVVDRLGFDSNAVSQSIMDLTSFSRYNHAKSINYDENGGTYSVTETWTLSPYNYTEDFTVTTATSATSSLNSVTVEGLITGLETRSDDLTLTSSKYTNASAAWTTIAPTLHTRAQSYSGLSLNSSALTTNVGKNPVKGTISYNYTYDNRPTNLISGAYSEVISISDRWDVEAFAPITVLGRTVGPLLQGLGTHQAIVRDLSIEAVMAPPSGTLANKFASKPNITAIVTAAWPGTYGITTVKVSDQSETWSIVDGRYTYRAQWTYENPSLIASAGLRGNA